MMTHSSYEMLDGILKLHIERGLGAEDIAEQVTIIRPL